MFTSYFAKNKNHKDAVAITAFKPGWFNGKHYSPLAPTWDLVDKYKKGKTSEAQYTEEFLKLLEKTTLEQVLKDLGNDAILLCYEGPGKFCHRHIVAEWLRKGGVECSEI